MKAIFLDRDGVINRYPGDTKYVRSWKEFRFLPGAKQAIAKLNKAGFEIFIVSNQAGVGKGIFSQKKLNLITKNMLAEIEKSHGKIKRILYCTHRPEENCPCRKPRAGLIVIAKNNYPVKLKESFFIGDTIRDVHTAKVAGCKSILVLSGKEKQANHKNWEIQPDFVFADLWEAAEFILRQR
jgi:histidinol-phosphate phosphatase family protein